MTARVPRVLLLVCDSFGVGGAPDAHAYGDLGSDTLGNTARAIGGLRAPNLADLGLGHLTTIDGVPPRAVHGTAYGACIERSAGKDTTTGHWEIAGIVLDRPFPLYPDGFPPEVIDPFEAAIGRAVLGNLPASGTEIIAEMGEEHLATGRPIVYTSGDSVFQIACHVDVVDLETLYAWCRAARSLLTGTHNVGRVIARPFEGRPGAFVRRPERRDFSVEPPGPTLCDRALDAGVAVYGPVQEMKHEDWEWSINVNLWGVIHGVRTFLPIMLRQDTEWQRFANARAWRSIIWLLSSSSACGGVVVTLRCATLWNGSARSKTLRMGSGALRSHLL